MVRLFLCFVIWIMVAASGEALSNTKIKMIFSDEYPPYYYFNENKGMYFEFLDAFERAYPEFKIERVTLSRKRIDASLVSGSADAYALTSTEFLPDDMHKKYIPTAVIWRSSDVLLSLNENKLKQVAPTDLIGKTIGVIHGNHYMHYNAYMERDAIHRIDAYNTAELLTMLVAKRIDGVFINQPSLTTHFQQQNFSPSLFYIANEPLYIFDLVTMVNAKHQDFFDSFNSFIKHSKENKWLTKLKSKHLEVAKNRLINEH